MYENIEVISHGTHEVLVLPRGVLIPIWHDIVNNHGYVKRDNMLIYIGGGNGNHQQRIGRGLVPKIVNELAQPDTEVVVPILLTMTQRNFNPPNWRIVITQDWKAYRVTSRSTTKISKQKEFPIQKFLTDKEINKLFEKWYTKLGIT